MKRLVLLFFLFSFLINSCTLVVPAVMWATQEKVSHEDVMNSYKTKKDVIRNFGLPSSKVSEAGIEIWTYKAGPNNTNKIIEGSIEFQFEDGDNVSAWRTEEHENYGNVNERVKKTYIGYIIGGAIDLVLLVVIPIAILAGA